MEFEPHVTVATVVEKDGRYLLVEEHASGRLVYNQPAGHLEAGESLQQAALRETLEETGWKIELLGVIGISVYRSADSGATYLRTTFSATAVEQVHTSLDTGIVRALWMSHEEMLASSGKMRSPLVITSVEKHLAGTCHPLDLIY